MPFDLDRGYRVIDALREVGKRHGVSPVRVAIAWTMSRPAISSVIVAARTHEHLEDNLLASDLKLTAEDFATLDEASNPGTPYPRWMVLQLDQAEDPRPKTLAPERFADGGPWRDLRGRKFGE